MFQSGNAVFMRNWPYAWALGNAADSPIKGKIGVAALPQGRRGRQAHRRRSAAGSSPSRNTRAQPGRRGRSRHVPDQHDEQKRRAIEGSYNPTIAKLYKDPEVLAASPFFGDLYDTFVNAVARPSRVTGAKYNQVSSEFCNAAHEVLTGKSDGATQRRRAREEARPALARRPLVRRAASGRTLRVPALRTARRPWTGRRRSGSAP